MYRKGIDMENYVGQPWSIEIRFDEKKAHKNGFDANTLYDYVDKNIAKYGLKRISKFAWKANEEDKANSQYLALSMLSKQNWVMNNISNILTYEYTDKAIDYLDLIKEYFPERISE